MEANSRPAMSKERKTRIIINTAMILLTSIFTIAYNLHIFQVDDKGFAVAGLFYALRYIPMMVTAAVGGSIPGMISVLIIFIYRTFYEASFSYMTFIYLMVVTIADMLARKKCFDRFIKVLPVTFLMQALVGPFWGTVLLLLTDNGLKSFSLMQAVYLFLNELPGCIAGSIIIYLIFNRIPNEKKLMLTNGKYYVPIQMLNEDDRFLVEGRSKLSYVVMNIIVFEALILGISAELASNAITVGMRQDYVYEERSQAVSDVDYSRLKSTERIESAVSEDLIKEVHSETEHFARSIFGGRFNWKFSIKLAMIIAIIVLPLAVFVNRYAQRRITKPIRALSKAMANIYNTKDRDMAQSIEDIHNLTIDTNDEIEELYHAVDLSVYRLVEYIDLVKTRQNIEDELTVAQSANEAKSRFLSNMSHEIRTPINAVLGFDEMILRECKDENILGYANDIKSSGKTLLALINDILDFSKIEAGKMEIVPVEYELGSMINDLMNMSEMRAREKNLRLNVNINESIPHVLFGDEVRIKQCIINIVTNAVKYTETGSVDLNVDYEVLDSDDPVENNVDKILLKVSVTDTGIGIREEDMDKLVSAFERIDVKRNRTIEGTGLGISIVTSLLDLMGSKLEVKSEYGKGSIFSFAIEQNVVDWEPVGDFSENARELKKQIGGYSESFRAPDARILVVDDTRTNLTVIVGLLKQTLIQVDTATSGMEALELVTKNNYDIIFLDHRMPEMDGIQTFHAMENLKGSLNGDTPVIALTANAVSGSREMYMREGFEGYMSKPVDPKKLEELILSYLPKEMILRPGDSGYAPVESNEVDEEKAALQELLKIPGVDVNAAISRCGSALVAKEVMKDFYLAIDERAGLIEKYMESGNIKDYTIYVHGLKSSAKAIGAHELSERAEYLENCGNGGDVEEIEMLTPRLLELYRSYIRRLEVLAVEDEDNKPLIDPDELEGAFASIKEFVSASYFDSADDIMKMLEEYRIPDDQKHKYHEIKRLIAAVDRDGLLNIL